LLLNLANSRHVWSSLTCKFAKQKWTEAAWDR
jgi:hypothetical protein